MADKMDIKLKKVITPKGRVSFPHVFTAHSFEGQEAKFQCTLLFTHKTDLSEMKKAAENAAKEKWGTDKTKWPKTLRWPFRNGDEKQDLMGYAGHYYVTATSKQKPGLVNNNRDPILDQQEFYAGCYARASLIAFAYDTKGNKGVSFSLQNLQKLGDGQAFSGRKKAEDEFDSQDDASDDPSSYGSQESNSDSEEVDMGF